MGTNVTTAEINQYYPTLQPVLSGIQDMIPSGKSTNVEQQRALTAMANATVAENQVFKDTLSNSLQSQVDKYVDLSYRLNDYNEIYGTNKYLQKELKSSEDKLGKLSAKLKNKIFISKQKSQMYEYQRNKILFYKNLFLFSCFVIVELMALVGSHLAGQISAKLLYIVTGISVTIYLIIVFMWIYTNSFRSHTDWDKYMWTTVGKSTSSGTCPTMDPEPDTTSTPIQPSSVSTVGTCGNVGIGTSGRV